MVPSSKTFVCSLEWMTLYIYNSKMTIYCHSGVFVRRPSQSKTEKALPKHTVTSNTVGSVYIEQADLLLYITSHQSKRVGDDEDACVVV